MLSEKIKLFLSVWGGEVGRMYLIKVHFIFDRSFNRFEVPQLGCLVQSNVCCGWILGYSTHKYRNVSFQDVYYIKTILQ